MRVEEALRSINSKDVEFIQRMVSVEHDSKTQFPLKFLYQRQRYKVTKILGSFKGDLSTEDIAFLVKTDDGNIYLLDLHFIEHNGCNSPPQGFWILRLRILRDDELMFFYRGERKMLVNLQLKKVVDFHGHLCPDLVIGCRASELALKTLLSKREANNSLVVIAENKTSALDAIQNITGCTVGNGRLVVRDYGKHKYTFMTNHHARALKISLKERYINAGEEYLGLEEKIIRNEATVEEVALFQVLLDERVKMLLLLKHDELFDIVEAKKEFPRADVSTVFSRCPLCGDLTLRSRLLDMNGMFICKPCFDRMRHAFFTPRPKYSSYNN